MRVQSPNRVNHNNNIVSVNKLTCKVVDSEFNKTVIFDTYVNDKDSKKFKICKRYTFDRFNNITDVEVNDRELTSGIKDRLNVTFKGLFNFSMTDIIINK